ncbi:unnamed protein product [Rotaria magnacalcarata]|uniref:Uncharacterized protein n=1 Tax=Rotaria magnacalcarata TaxID=392030 RepID=A0A819S4Y0_9BILA|nr:unnamed protein product [Rotaria magnacalcarata]CAF4057587.1 unnamed protein product [Rotaria magnacalcarata]
MSSTCKFLHPYSAPVNSVETAIFTLPETQVSTESSIWCEINPSGNFDADSSPIDFVISGSTEYYIDSSEIYIYLKCQLVNQDGTLVKKDEILYPEQSFGNTFFKNVETYINDQAVSIGPTHYAIQSYIGNLLNFSHGSKKGVLSSGGYYTDEQAHSDKFSKSTDKIWDVFSKVNVSLCNQPKLIPNNCEVKFKFQRAPPGYYLRTSSDTIANKSPYAKILETYLMVRKVKLTTKTFLDNEKALLANSAFYPLDRVDTKFFSISQGVSNHNIDHLSLGQEPKRILVAFQLNKILNGDYKSDSFDFTNFDIRNLSLFLNGNLYQRAYETKFSTNTDSIPLISRAYMSLILNTTGIDPVGNDINIDDFNKSTTLFCFDLTSSHDDCFTLINPVNNGEVGLKIQFGTPTPAVVSAIVILQYSSMLEIDGTRSILVK